MKKLLIALLVGSMIAGAASIAAAEITVGGSLEVRYDLWHDLQLNHFAQLSAAPGTGGTQETNLFWGQRVLLNVDAKVAEGLEGYVELDTENTEDWWGGNQAGLNTGPLDGSSISTRTTTTVDDTSGAPGIQQTVPVTVTSNDAPDTTTIAIVNGRRVVVTNPNNGAGTADVSGLQLTSNSTSVSTSSRAYLNHHDSTMRIKQAWINFMIPGAPVGIKIGHQPLALGHGIFLDTHRMGSDAVLVFSKPIPELLLAAVAIEGFDNLSYVPDNTSGAGHAVNFYAALANYTWMENNTAGVNFTYVHDTNPEALGLSHHNRVYATNTAAVMDGTIAGIGYKGEVDWLYINSLDAFDGSGLGTDYTVNAWAAMVGANYNVMDIAKVGLDVAYGTGNSWNDGNVLYNPSGHGATLDNNDHAYATPYNATSYNYAFLYNDKIGQGVLGSGGGQGLGDGTGGFGLANTGYAKLSAGFTPMDKLTAGIDVLWLRASATPIPSQSRDLGWEVDANVGVKIYDNLKWDIMGGVFMPGAYYAFQGRTNNAGVSNTEQLTDPDNLASPIKRDLAFGAETKLTMNF